MISILVGQIQPGLEDARVASAQLDWGTFPMNWWCMSITSTLNTGHPQNLPSQHNHVDGPWAEDGVDLDHDLGLA
ncbi:hypothetical protein MRB53_025729 [Persea americana]|uniref:Uncharacterized protein n=1 Tax=Persea americana TaxID=3435 RepID=A0ACC2LGD9_PERAE|nr:hypothetical protein MRB53_025729 [Persea americana]